MILSRGRVSAQGHQIFDSGLMELLQQGFDFQACVGNTGESEQMRLVGPMATATQTFSPGWSCLKRLAALSATSTEARFSCST